MVSLNKKISLAIAQLFILIAASQSTHTFASTSFIPQKSIMIRSAKSSDIPALVELHIYAWTELYKDWVRPDQRPNLDRNYRSE